MTLREKAAIVSAILVIVGTAWYIYLALSGKKVKPVLAVWIINSMATILSFTTYMTSPKHSWISNAYNATSIFTTTSILVVAIIVARREKKALIFSPFQRGCLCASALIVIIWITLVWGLGRTGILPNILTQFMMLIGYFVLGERLWKATQNTESLISWWCIVTASLAGMVTAAISHDVLASVFAGRTFFGTFTLVLLMHRLERRSKLN